MCCSPTTLCAFLLVTLLTVFRCAHTAVSYRNLGNFVSTYDTLSYDTQPVENHLQRHKRSLDAKTNENEPITIRFHAFGEHFHLELEPDLLIFGPHAYLEVNGKKEPIDRSVALHGRLKNRPNSHVFGSVIDGVFRGTIAPEGHSHPDGAFFVEPSGNYFDEDPGFHSVIYHDRHVTYEKPVNTFNKDTHRVKREAARPATLCGWSQPKVVEEMEKLMPKDGPRSQPYAQKQVQQPDGSSYFAEYLSGRSRRGTPGAKNDPRDYTTRVCNLFLQSDTLLWNRVMQMTHINKDEKKAKQEITSLFTQHVGGAQAIYQNAQLKDFSGSLNYMGVSFRVDRIQINTTDDCVNSFDNPFCSANIDVTNYLNLNSFMNHDDFCLAYAFTYRDFTGGTLGLAWVAEPGGSGGICEKYRTMRDGDRDVKKSLNTGIVTLLNYGSHVALKVSQLTFAHEMGHNFGSKHDDDHKEHRECLPDTENPKGNFIMFASATSGDKENNNQFSACSKDSVSRLIHQVLKSENSCFKHSNSSFCGNSLQEGEEECDCGYDSGDCKDQCCHPKSSNKLGCKLRDSVKIKGLVTKVQCSPTAGECCTNDCQHSAAKLCRPRGQCYEAAQCNGTSGKCPESKKVADGTPCQDHTRICKDGQCLGSICERIPGWHECSLKRDDQTNDSMMCYVSCKSNKSACINTYKLEKDPELQKKYERLAKELLRNGKGIQLKPGAPCDNYRGYCDSFSRCRSVDADGPLARLRNLIFSPQMLTKVKDWIIGHWWAVILISICLIAFMIIFVKVCAVHTPSSNPHQPAQRKISIRHRTIASNAVPVRSSRNPYPPTVPHPNGRQRPISMNVQEMAPLGPPPMQGPSSSVGGYWSGPHVPPGVIMQSPPPSAPNYPPPDYNEIEIMQPPIQHGKGKGKKGHLHALNQQANKYKH